MRMINNAGVRSRIRQVLILLIVIVIGILISHAVGAQDFHRANSRHFKAKYKAQIKWSGKACSLLAKKRTEKPSKPMFAFLKSKPKYKPMAEVDAPSWASSKSVLASNIKRGKTFTEGQ